MASDTTQHAADGATVMRASHAPRSHHGPGGAAADRPWRAAGQQVRRWLRGLPRDGRIGVVIGPRPDAVASSVLLIRALGGGNWRVVRFVPPKGWPAWSPATVDWVERERLDGVVAAGSGAPDAWPARAPLLVLDHRALGPLPPEVVGISGVDWRPPPSSSALAFWLMQSITDLRRFDWIAAIGAMDSLGDATDHPLVDAARKAQGAGWLRDLLRLLHATSSGPEPLSQIAVALLLGARDARDAVLRPRPERDRLLQAGAATEAAIAVAKEVSPVPDLPFVLISTDSVCRVQEVLLSVWQARRPGAPVLVANTGYLAGRVAFTTDRAADAWWTAVAQCLPAGTVVDDSTLRGDAAVGAGHMAAEEWDVFIQALAAGWAMRQAQRTHQEHA